MANSLLKRARANSRTGRTATSREPRPRHHRCYPHPAGGTAPTQRSGGGAQVLPRLRGSTLRFEYEFRSGNLTGKTRRPKREGCPNDFGLPVHHPLAISDITLRLRHDPNTERARPKRSRADSEKWL